MAAPSSEPHQFTQDRAGDTHRARPRCIGQLARDHWAVRRGGALGCGSTAFSPSASAGRPALGGILDPAGRQAIAGDTLRGARRRCGSYRCGSWRRRWRATSSSFSARSLTGYASVRSRRASAVSKLNTLCEAAFIFAVIGREQFSGPARLGGRAARRPDVRDGRDQRHRLRPALRPQRAGTSRGAAAASGVPADRSSHEAARARREAARGMRFSRASPRG